MGWGPEFSSREPLSRRLLELGLAKSKKYVNTHERAQIIQEGPGEPFPDT